jgi:hypothetical protein
LQDKGKMNFGGLVCRVGIGVAKAVCANVSLAGRAQLNQQQK